MLTNHVELRIGSSLRGFILIDLTIEWFAIPRSRTGVGQIRHGSAMCITALGGDFPVAVEKRHRPLAGQAKIFYESAWHDAFHIEA